MSEERQQPESGGERERAEERSRQLDGRMQELVAMVRRVLVDGQVSESETMALASWLGANSDLLSQWPANAIAGQLGLVLEDGRIEEEEREALAQTLERLVGRE